ncbi:MAG: hypothetical protein HS111_14705 [Kofleriaceae bacterium]|nr:hypothetical protein [Kofleriaceae bacterium]
MARARHAATAAAAPCAAPALAFTDGHADGWLCPDAAAAAGLTVVDLSDGWTPRPFAPGPDGSAPRFRDQYLALAREESPDGEELAPEEQFVELYGVIPSLATVRRRLEDTDRHACHDAVDPAPLGAFTRSLSEANAAAVAAATRQRAWLGPLLERERTRRRLPDLAALARVPAWRARVATFQRVDAQHAAMTTMQAHLVCDQLLPRRRVDGLFSWHTGYALEMFQRKNFLVPNARLDAETRAALLAGSRELAFRAALRVLRERVADATGLIEDGTAGAGPIPVLGRQLEPGVMRAARGHRPLPRAAPDHVGAATEVAARALGWTDVERARAWLAGHGAGAGLRVALALPPPPPYHAAHMELSVEIDRGDVWYDDRPIPRVTPRRPALVLYAHHGGERVPLVRWPTTIGAWSDVRLPSGYVVQRWKESEVGKRIWRDLYAAPVWYPPPSTPDRDLVKYGWNGRWRLKRELLGPGPRSAYGMVMLVHHLEVPRGRGQVRHDDHGIRVHGSSSVTSIAHGTSHGCHRLFNHLAVRLGGFLLAHRHHERKGEDARPFRRIVNYRGRHEARLDSRGYLYQLTPPVPVEVLPGRIRSARKVPPRNSAPAKP